MDRALVATRMKWVGIVLVMLASLQRPFGQENVTLLSCYEKAWKNYPLIQQSGLIQELSEVTLSNVSKGYLPQLWVNGQATYQSDVTGLPIHIPGMVIPSLSKDQYKLYGEVNQPVSDLVFVQAQQDLVKANSTVESMRVEVEMYKLFDRVNQLYFGALLLDEQLKILGWTRADLMTAKDRWVTQMNLGTATQQQVDMVEVEMLKIQQREVELRANRQGLLVMLGALMGEKVADETKMEMPPQTSWNMPLNRPELRLYDAQTSALDAQMKVLKCKSIPRVNLFLQSGYGRPALNMLSNEFEFYYIGGVRLSWNISNYYTYSKEKKSIELNKKAVEIQKKTFVFNTNLSSSQQGQDYSKWDELLKQDASIVKLRERIRDAVDAQLTEGTMTVTEQMQALDALEQARQNENLHRIQRLQAQYNLNTTMGGQTK